MGSKQRGGRIARRAWNALCGSALFLPCALTAGSARAETLQDALVSAYSNNPTIQAERATLEATNENVPQALANWRPTVTISASQGKEDTFQKTNCSSSKATYPDPCGGTIPAGIPALDGFDTYRELNVHPETYGLTITQPVFRGGRTVAQTAEALNLVQSERAHLVGVEQSVFFQVVTDYLAVVEQKAIVDLNVTNEQVLRKQLDGTEQRYKLGELTHTDVRLGEAAYAQAIASRHVAEGQLQVSRAAYEHDVGEVPGDLVAPTSMPELPATRDEALSVASVSAPAVVQAQYAQKAAEDDINVIRGQLLPTITLQGSATQNRQSASYAGASVADLQVIAQASMPLYEGGQIYSQTRQAAKTVAVRKSQLDDARRAATQLATQTWEALKATREQIVALKTAVDANQFALNGLEEEEHVGTRTVQDVLIQQQALFQTQVNLVTAQHDELLAQFDLVQAVGRLTARNLGLPVEYYDPDQEFDEVRGKWIGFGTGP